MKTLLTTALITLVLPLAACGGGQGIEVDQPWARTSPMVTSAGAVYMNLTSSADDRLIGAAVDSSIAAIVELHETVMADGMEHEMTDDSMEMEDGMEMGDGTMTMQRVQSIELPSGETVSLEPGGYHIMMMQLGAPLESGQTFDLTLQFENAGDQVVEIEVRDEAP